MSISKEEWNQITNELRAVYGQVELKLDEHVISLKKAFISENQLAVVVYINGQISPIAGFPNDKNYNPLTAKLWHKRTRALYKQAAIKRIKKDFKVREIKECFPELESKQTSYDFWFSKTAPLIRLYKAIDGLEVVSIGYVPKEAE